MPKGQKQAALSQDGKPIGSVFKSWKEMFTNKQLLKWKKNQTKKPKLHLKGRHSMDL